MLLWRSGAVSALVGCLALAACTSWPGTAPPAPPAYDVRSATVVADQAVPPVSPVLLSAINERVNAAIAVTTRDTVLPKVALTIRLTDVRKAGSFNHDRNTAKINIDVDSVDTGAVLAIASFDTANFTPDPNAADNLMAEDIAARIRSIFVLKAPPLVN
ncbi:hypothetical protein ACXHXG_06760 [Rhizobium sp. LEGMi198b]|uniref:hypothetical protein n=1 Tax=unclassified Rhizobium TaxID=2613769 RepID=UPI000CDF4F29|nr:MULTISPECIES: hypothetical protein [Rhizobium]AVA21687.1 hypothetical protein NXC24_CH02049 [Rhizobium sp. NXC24]MDK4737612.1 hypothetical protein [Rhizobium sp. CNPSo 3464]UWU22748.1 hypothetical protein N2601_07320 [Rhizobium tropici]WFU03539.1 hypothetical protein QA648_07275 [Rhizobium sp. CB3171]